MNKSIIITSAIFFLFIGISFNPVITAHKQIQEETNQGWYYLSSFNNFAPKGLPDISQRQHGWRYIYDGGNKIAESNAEGDDLQIISYGSRIMNYDPIIVMGPNCYLESTPGGDDIEFWNFCFLVSVSNCLWWLDSKYEDPTGIPGDGIDSFPLVQDYGIGDDHSPENAPLLVCDMANLLGTASYNASFTFQDFDQRIQEWMTKKGIGDMFTFSYYRYPTYQLISEEISQDKPVMLYIAFYKKNDELYEFAGNHYVSCAGINTDEKKIAFSDPFLDINNPNDIDDWNESTNHNNAENVSHDIYQITYGSPFSNDEYTKCWLPDYWPYYDFCTINWAISIDEIKYTHDRPTITGPTEGKKGENYTYTFQNTDTDFDEVSYYIDWGDNTAGGWTRYRPADDPLIASHTWDDKSINTIRVKIKDEEGKQSSWGELQVTIAKEKNIFEIVYKQIIQHSTLLKIIIHKLGLESEYYIQTNEQDVSMHLIPIPTNYNVKNNAI